MPTPPSILLLSNHPLDSGNPGQVDALQLMWRSHEIGEVSVVNAAPRAGETQQASDRRVIDGIRAARADVVLALSLKNLVRDVEGARTALAGRPLIYWEGDPWGRGKPISPEMGAWLEQATHVFSVGGRPQVELLLSQGARRVDHTIHSYDHVLFDGSERGVRSDPEVDVAFIGSNASWFPVVSGLPGSFRRGQLVAAMRRRHRQQFLLAGPGWPPGLGIGKVPFGEQDRFMQRARLLVNWDHYPRIEAYTSDRMAICMIAGRPQVSTRHPGMEWLPGAEAGLFLEDSVGRVIDRAEHLLSLPPAELDDAGRAAHAWARHRISHREAMRHMLSIVFPDIERPPADPWDRLPGPWVR